ncbi:MULTISPECIES: hypothetical protein [Sphingomonadales]|uniref:Uncharacterized protein n=2 Tax=Edaphosphingomonas TaxID=3423724 RepID=A0A2T4HVP3_9SPHN|nr:MULTISPECIES: hypothetical protein [Sphingomonas]AGH48778.1 hypothetical protein G432_05255 [Sphingomonas sp. MM-1]MDX3884018.1 hypothetical protein [Sphingomonas sp.]OHT19896.1 hypothetical protein BHE75_01889 [Sphingomonas haloaromaticamans]PTD19888.1 hypothetical protein CV103_11915 [Sphingomonas fennica]
MTPPARLAAIRAVRTAAHDLAAACALLLAGQRCGCRADDLIRSSFPVDPATPPDMIETLARIDKAAS